MASKKSYLDYILDRMKLLDGITYTEDNNNFLLYKDGIEFGGIFEDKLCVYNTKRAIELIPYAKEVSVERYGKVIDALHVSEIGNRIVLKELVQFLIKDLKNE